MPRSRSISIESRICSFPAISRASIAPVSPISRSASVDLPWSMCATFVSQHFWRENGLRTLQAITEPRIELIAGAVRAEINRQDHLPIVLALDADVRRALTNPQDHAQLEQINHKLRRIIAEADTRALYVIGRDGIVLAAASSDPAEVV